MKCKSCGLAAKAQLTWARLSENIWINPLALQIITTASSGKSEEPFASVGATPYISNSTAASCKGGGWFDPFENWSLQNFYDTQNQQMQWIKYIIEVLQFFAAVSLLALV